MTLTMSNTSERVRALNPGDPWTFIVAQPIFTEDNIAAVPGDIIAKWYSTDEPGREFRIIAVHQMTDALAYETRFVGFQQIEVRPAVEELEL